MGLLIAKRCGAALMGMLLGAMVNATPYPASAQTTGNHRQSHVRAEAQDDVVVKEIHIALIRNVLKLRPAQEPHWVPIESALRELAQIQAAKAAGPVVQTSTRAYANFVMRRLKRIAAIARPLLISLDENQRHDLAILAQIAGLQVLLASR